MDFSDRCTAAAPHIVAMAKHFRAKLTLLHLIETPPVWYGGIAAAQLESLVDTEELARERRVELDGYLKDELATLPEVDRIVRRGSPAWMIAECAREETADLIMMPTHGYGPFRRLLLGSVTAKVLHDAECPVWTDVHEEASFAPNGCRSVLCAVDLRDESVSPIQWAAALAESYAADLTLMHAVPALVGPTPPEDFRFRTYLVQYAREFITELQRKAGTAARVCIEGGKIAETVRHAAIAHKADVVVIGQGCMHETLGRLRSNAYNIVREAPCPVVRV